MQRLGAAFRGDTVNLAMSHLYVLGGLETDSERPIQIGGAYTVDPSALRIGAQYVALGHLHRPQRVAGDETMRYSGSPLAYSFSEADTRNRLPSLTPSPASPSCRGEIPLELRPAVGQLERQGRHRRSGTAGWKKAATRGVDRSQRPYDGGDDAAAYPAASPPCTKDSYIFGPIYPETAEAIELDARSREQLPAEELFRRFFARQTGGGGAGRGDGSLVPGADRGRRRRRGAGIRESEAAAMHAGGEGA